PVSAPVQKSPHCLAASSWMLSNSEGRAARPTAASVAAWASAKGSKGSVGFGFVMLLAEQVAADDHAHDLVGAFQDRMDPKIPPEALDRVILQIAVTAVKLERAIDDRRPAVCRKPLRHRCKARL